MSYWLCPCGARRAKAERVCPDCGADRPTAAPVSSTTPAPSSRRCPHVEDPDALCPDCAAAIKKAQDEFKRHVQAIAVRNERAKTAAEIEQAKRAAQLPPQTFAPTCAGCAVPIDAEARWRYEDGRLWHHVCWERQRARMKHQRKTRARAYAR